MAEKSHSFILWLCLGVEVCAILKCDIQQRLFIEILCINVYFPDIHSFKNTTPQCLGCHGWAAKGWDDCQRIHLIYCGGLSFVCLDDNISKF